MAVTPERFIEKWRANERTERQASHEHFLDLCELLDVPKPSDADSRGEDYTFDKSTRKPDGSQGFADVFKRDCFAWEYKGDRRNLVAAHSQLKEYVGALGNPPLLIVSDMREIRVHTSFTGAISEQIVIGLPDLNDFKVRQRLRDAFLDPEKFRPQKTREAVTVDAARAFADIAQKLRDARYDPRQVAHFLNKMVFCLFAEDIDLLPERIFADILEESAKNPDRFRGMLGDLFRAMKDKNGSFGKLAIPWFNGGLFDDDDVLPLTFHQITEVVRASRLDWSAIEPSIFGTLFEMGLDPERRKEMASLFDAGAAAAKKPQNGLFDKTQADKGVGIHYTDPATIMKIVEPVVLRPLRLEWETVKEQVKKHRAAKAAAKTDAERTRHENAARRAYLDFRERLGKFRVLDPACGSGNFLYLSLLHLKGLDLAVFNEATAMGLPADNQRIGPDAMMGIEINPYAAELARVTLWIGEIQWQMRNGLGVTVRPILGRLDGIACRDALLTSDGKEAKWPEADVIVGNPPFLGDKAMIRNLREDYVTRLRSIFEGRVPGGADLVCYWFEKARAKMESGETHWIGLVATNSIRGGQIVQSLIALLKMAKFLMLGLMRNGPLPGPPFGCR